MPPREIDGIEELKTLIGQEVGVSDWLEITQERIQQFATATDDHQWIHVDPERAARDSPYETTIAHGFLSLSLVSMLAWRAVKVKGDYKMGINYGLNRVRFPAPVPAGARIRGRFTIQNVELFDWGYQITWGVKIEAEGAEKPSVVAEWITRAYL